MSYRHTFLALLVSLFFIGGVQAAGSPMHEDFSKLVSLTQKAIETGKTGNMEAFTADTVAAQQLAKEQSTTANSPSMQRIAGKLRTAMNLAKEGKIAEATAALEEALETMKEPPKAQRFGGGS